MPWITEASYMELKKPELKKLLIRRHLPYSGNKTKMTARLEAYDNEHPFRFLELPAELRNKIYKLVAEYVLERSDPQAKIISSLPSGLSGPGKLMALQPGLFSVCKQVRLEGLPIFYQDRRFSFAICRTDCYWERSPAVFSAILGWLKRIGAVGRGNIRNLKLNGCFELTDWLNMDRTHAQLSDKATVVHEECIDANGLWEIGKTCEASDTRGAPTFWFHHNNYTTYSNIPQFEPYAWCRLTFYAGKSWFGGNHEPIGQVATSEERTEVGALGAT